MRYGSMAGTQERKPIRVLQVLNRIAYGSGACAVILNYYEHMDPHNIRFDFLVHGETDPKLGRKLRQMGSKIYRMPSLCVRNVCAYEKALEKFFKEHTEYKIIHGNLPNAAVFYLRAAKRAGVPVRIVHAHLAKGVKRSGKDVRNFLLGRIGIGYANVCFACSKEAAEYLYGTKSGRACLVRNAIDVDRYRFDEKKRMAYRRIIGAGNALVLGHVGRFSEEKNHRFLLDILYAVKKRGIRCKLLLVGDGKTKGEIMRRAAGLGLTEDVVYTGMVERTEGWLHAMDVFLLPSFAEGLPLAGIEAQCSGLPCLFSDAVTREAKILDTARFLPPGNAEAWADAALGMQEKRTEDAWRQAESVGYSIRKEAGKLEAFYFRAASRTAQKNMNQCLKS